MTGRGAFLRALALVLLPMLLSGCINDTPYSSNYAHISVHPEGPGSIVMTTSRLGETTCRESSAWEACSYTVYLLDDELVTFLAMPDEGHEFAGWEQRPGSTGWTDELSQGSNPLFLLADGDYFLRGVFR